jgi:translation elongation factor EF-Ts
MNALQEIAQFRTLVRSHLPLELAQHVFIECDDGNYVRYKHGGRIGAQFNALTPQEAEKAAKSILMAIAALKPVRQNTGPLRDSRNDQRRGKLGGIKEG